ncbi:MAG: hypothetical protein FWF03_08860 [Defluviitaleaceae bacterium]|nr:hypothetical protein [Defluviitaleaceae bacterium]
MRGEVKIKPDWLRILVRRINDATLIGDISSETLTELLALLSGSTAPDPKTAGNCLYEKKFWEADN